MLSDPDLFAKIAKEKNVLPGSLGTVIRRNGSSINEFRIVEIVADHIGVDMETLMEEVEETEQTKN
jgi:hypothetical protein